MRVLLLVNASASSVTARTRVVIQKALAADHKVTLAETSRRGHASRLAQGAAADGLDLVVVLGGDGTLNEAANGLVGTDTGLGVLPGGSTNVFARTIGMTNDPIEATGQLLSALADGRVGPVNLGSVNGRYFLFHVGFGFDAAVVDQVDRRSSLKRYFGHAVFLWAAVATWSRHYDRSRPHFALHHEPASGCLQVADVDDGYFGVCLNTNPYTYLGRRSLDLAPGTDLYTGLSMVTFRNLELRTLLPAAAAALRGGDRLGGRHVQVDHGQESLVLTGYGELPYQVDGEYLGKAHRLVVRSEPSCLRLLLPRRPAVDLR